VTLRVPVTATNLADWIRKAATAINSVINNAASAGGTAAWGGITGTLSSQTDLQTALDAKQPLDGDLTAIAALSGTNTIYYRSAASTWSAVTVGTGLGFAAGTLSNTSSVTPAALTRVDDTNVTLTLGGTPATALLQATSLTLGWTGTLSIARGGTAASTAAGARVSLLPSLTGNASKVLSVNVGETDVEWTAAAGGGTVTTTGSPANGNLTKFSGATSITNGDLSGDVTTSGTLVTTLANTAVTPGSYTKASITVDSKGRLTAASTGAFRGALVKKSADQTTANYTGTAFVAWDAESYDTDTIHDTVTNNTRLTVPSGVTRVRIGAQIATSLVGSNDVLVLDIYKNNSGTYDGYATIRSSTANTAPGIDIWSPVLTVTAGDYFEARFTVVTDTSITVLANGSWFAMEIIE
jgi:hypothetical protein